MVTVYDPIDSSLKCLSYLSYNLIPALLSGIIARHTDGMIISHMVLSTDLSLIVVPVIMVRTPTNEMKRTIKSTLDKATL